MANRYLIIDTDSGIDDAIATLYLLNQKDITVKAITITGAGEAHCAAAMKNWRGLLALTNQNGIPLACGRTTPLQGVHEFTAEVRHNADVLSHTDTLLPPSSIAVSTHETALALLTDTLTQTPTPVDILAIGPLTNIAELFAQHPRLKQKIRTIYVMGGAVHVPGNLSDVDLRLRKNKQAEWNIFLDPAAARIVFQSGVRVVLIDLDVTNKVPVTDRFYRRFNAAAHSDASKFIAALLKQNHKEIVSHQWYFWDTLAAAVAADESLVTLKPEKLTVRLDPESMSGVTEVDSKHGAIILTAVDIDKARFTRHFLRDL